MKQLLFIMPFGEKTFRNEEVEKNIEIDFDKKYKEIKEKINNLAPDFGKNFNINRVDNLSGTDMYKSMYKAIHAADVVLADLTSLNPNVMYELGARHALRDKKTILFHQNEIERKIPFDINTFKIWNINDLLSNFVNIINNNEADSPIKKEIDSNYNKDKSVFIDYSCKWEEFENLYDECDALDIAKKYKILEKYKNIFTGIEEFDQKYSLNHYKLRNNLEGLTESLQIIKKHNPNTSVNHETIGLACSISRKIFELTGNQKDLLKSYNYSRHFISAYKTPYSFSSYIYHLMVDMESHKKDISGNFNKKYYYKEELKIILNDFNSYCNSSHESSYFFHTKNLINVLNGIETDYYNDKKNNNSFEFVTSKQAYDRACKLWYNYFAKI